MKKKPKPPILHLGTCIIRGTTSLGYKMKIRTELGLHQNYKYGVGIKSYTLIPNAKIPDNTGPFCKVHKWKTGYILIQHMVLPEYVLMGIANNLQQLKVKVLTNKEAKKRIDKFLKKQT